jgi:hypothetical protein
VIALKAELAGRLLADRPADAANEVAEVERVARTALTEVRQAVSGYRQPTLDGELAGARMALSAAGIEADVQRPAIQLEPELEAILAWAVREGATNVIRHSGASHCAVTVSRILTDAAVEVLDDGIGVAGGNGGAAPGGARGAGGPPVALRRWGHPVALRRWGGPVALTAPADSVARTPRTDPAGRAAPANRVVPGHAAPPDPAVGLASRVWPSAPPASTGG